MPAEIIATISRSKSDEAADHNLDPFEPRRAESPSPIPVWLRVLSLVIATWAVWYVATQWKLPPEFSKTPTYDTQMLDKH